MSEFSIECEIRRLEALECLECPCYMYCNRESCINDLDEYDENYYRNQEIVEGLN